MRFLVRLRELFSARANALLDRFEDPASMATQALRDLESELDTLRQQAAMAIAVERRLGRELERQQTQVKHWREKARLALAEGREDLARWALARALPPHDLACDLQAQHDVAVRANSEIKDGLQAVQNRLWATHTRHLMLSAHQHTAKARHAVQQTLERQDDTTDSLSGRLAHWEERLTESADVLLALVEVSRPQPDEEVELVALATDRRIARELAALKRETVVDVCLPMPDKEKTDPANLSPTAGETGTMTGG